MATRDCVSPGSSVTLRATIKGHCGEFVDSDSGTLRCFIYPYDIDNDLLTEEIEAGTFDSAIIEVTSSIERISTGFYETTYSVPSDTEIGRWSDVWVCEIEGALVWMKLSFLVARPPRISAQKISKNTLMVILLDETISSIDGVSLGEDYQFTFSTEYDPYYASPDLIRLECGSWVEGIPEDTISLMIHWSSLEADAIKSPRNGKLLSMARTKFVIFDTAIRLLALPASPNGKKKSLGDLMISNDNSTMQMIQELKEQRDEWWRVVNAGGTIVPGQGLAPEIAIKGQYDPDRPKMGRLWWSPEEAYYATFAGNSRFKADNQLRYKTGFTPRYPRNNRF